MFEIKEILQEFDKQNINYCILRNFDSLTKDDEIDILVDNKKKIKPILKKMKFKKGAEYFQYLSFKREIWMDFKIGYLPYRGFSYKSATEILRNRRKVDGVWVMSKEDEFVHLILHSILDKRKFKEKYKERIKNLLKEVDKNKIVKELHFKFGKVGTNLFSLIEQEKYKESLMLRWKLLLQIFSLKDIPSNFIIQSIRLRNLLFRLIKNLSWIPYKILTKNKKTNAKKISLNFKKIGIDKKFVFNTLKGDTGLSADLNVFGFREPLNWKNYYYFVEKKDIVLDIGANLGLFSLLSNNAKKIIAVEPVKKCLPILKKNLLSNGLKNKSVIVNMAVGNKGSLRLRKDERLNRSVVVDKDFKGPIYEARSESLEFFVKKYSVNLLRMDVEGYEYEILKSKIPKNINKISLEFHAGIMGKEKSKELLKHLEKEGFIIEKIIEDLPLRLYPFYILLKKTGLLKKTININYNLSIRKSMPLIFSGRKIKYLFLKR